MQRKEKKRLVLILEPLGESDTKSMKIEVLTSGERVRILSPDELTPGDVLIIPDTGGFNLNTSGIYPHFTVPPAFTQGQDQWVEFFRVNDVLRWYLDKKIPVIGYGTSALLLYTEALGGKIGFDGRNIIPFKSNTSKGYFYNDTDFEGTTKQGGQVKGIRYFNPDTFMDDVYDMISPSGPQGAKVPVSVPPVKPSLTNKNENTVTENKPNFEEIDDEVVDL